MAQPIVNPTVSLNKPFDYEAEQDAILRRQKYADILNQEAMQPLKPGSYQGIEAPISPLSGLAKILQGAGAGYLESQAAEGKREFGQQARAAGDEFMRNLEIPPMQGAGEGDPGGFQKPQLHPTEAKRERLAKTLRGLSDPNPYVNIPAKAEYAESIRDRKIKSPYAPIVAKEYTPESIALFNRSINSDGKGGDYSLLVPVPPPGEKDHADVAGYKFYSQQTREAGGTPVSFQEYIHAKASAGSSRVSVNNVNGQQLTPLQIKMDQQHGETLAAWQQGGSSDVRMMLSSLKTVFQAMDEGKKLTGPAVGLQPDFLLSLTNPEALDARQRVEGVVQRNLRLILGAQFTEKEGSALIARAYNPMLSVEDNRKRVYSLMTQMELAANQKDAMLEYANKYGTMRGFIGRVPKNSDFDFPEWGPEPTKRGKRQSRNVTVTPLGSGG